MRQCAGDTPGRINQLSWRYSALDQISANVKNLAPAWIFQTGDYAENLHSTPMVVDGVMYLISARAQVFALYGLIGRVIWHYRCPTPSPGIPGSHSDFIQNRGVAVGNGKVFFGHEGQSPNFCGCQPVHTEALATRYGLM